MDLNLIKPYPKNAKVHPQKQVGQIARSITEFGFNQPIVVDANNEIIVGHGRYFAAKKLNLSDVPVIVKEDLTPEQVRAYRLADNRLNESDWEQKLLIEELKGLDSLGYDISLTGFDRDLIAEVKEDDAPPLPSVPVTKKGDLYILGEHRLLCGDAEKEDDFKTLMLGAKASLIFTDAPYSVDYKSPNGMSYQSTKYGGTGGKIFNDDKNDEEALVFYKKALENLKKFSHESACIYWWFANSKQGINRQAFEETGWHFSQIIIWLKNSPVFSHGQMFHRCYEPCMVGWQDKGSHYHNKKLANLRDVWTLDFDTFQQQLDVWFQKRDNTAQYLHPTQKPVKLATRALFKSSQQGDIVLDAFGGSGSTMIACEQLNRKCYMMELDPKFCDVIVKRYENYTGRKAEKISRQEVV